MKDPCPREVSHEGTLYYWTGLILLSSMAQGTLPSHYLTLPQYASTAYKDWWSKVTVNDLRTNVSFLEKSTEANSSRCEKDEEVGSSMMIQGKRSKLPMDDLDSKVPESGGIIRESPGIHLIEKKQGLRDMSDSEYDFEANFRHGGRKRRETVTPTTFGGSLGDDFFDDIETCSTESINLDEVTPFDLLLPFFFYKRRQSGPRFRSLTLV